MTIGEKVKGVLTGKKEPRGDKPVDSPEKLLYWWQPTDEDCPTNIVVNASPRPIIIGAMAFVPNDSPRLDIGDRRQGDYYVKEMTNKPQLGLTRLVDLSPERVRELDKKRRIRLGEEPADWIKAARARSERGEGPPALDDANTARTPFQRSVRGE